MAHFLKGIEGLSSIQWSLYEVSLLVALTFCITRFGSAKQVNQLTIFM